MPLQDLASSILASSGSGLFKPNLFGVPATLADGEASHNCGHILHAHATFSDDTNTQHKITSITTMIHSTWLRSHAHGTSRQDYRAQFMS